MLSVNYKSDNESDDECDSIDYNAYNKQTIDLLNGTQHIKKQTNSGIIFGLKAIRRKYASFMKEYHAQKEQAHLSLS